VPVFQAVPERPFQIASIVPSSKALVERVGSKMNFSRPRVIAEYCPGEGVHSRGIARRMTMDSHLLLFGLDAAFAHYLERQFAPRLAGNVSHAGCRAPQFLKGREFDAHFAEITVIYGKFICISQLQCTKFARLTSSSPCNGRAIFVR
jgi:phospholipid N-methyltransferase